VVKAVLHDTVYQPGHVHAVLPQDVVPVGTTPVVAHVNPTFQILQRVRTGFTDEGVAVYRWDELQTSEAYLWTDREEVDAATGATLVRGRATMANLQGVTALQESSVLIDVDSGFHWSVTRSTVTPTVVEVDAVRMSADGGGLEPSDVSPVVDTWRGISAELATFTMSGSLRVRQGVSRLPIKGGLFHVLSVAAALANASSGQPVIIDVNKNGTSIYSGPRPTFPAGSVDAVVPAHDDVRVTDGDWLSLDVDQIGTILPGSDLVVVVRMERVG
jgi:hypothetical protein